MNSVIDTPVNSIIDDNAITTDVKKKRGRKKKEDSTPVTEEQKIPKKRGRKPKGGKLINAPINNNNDSMSISNIILHLKCSIADLTTSHNVDNNIILDPIEYIPKPPPNVVAYDNNEQTFSHFGSVDNIDTQNGDDTGFDNTKILEHTCFKCKSAMHADNDSEISPPPQVDDSNMKDINMKLKQIKLQLYQNSNPDKKSACFWCTYEYDNQPCYIPKHEYNGELSGYGSFCRPECAVAYLLKENIDDSIKFERYHFLNKVYSQIYNFKKNIKPAPDPHYLLDKFYGNLNIQEYRKLMKSEHMLLVIEKPMTRILPELHDNTDDMENTGIHGSKGTLSKQSGVYKVKRESEKQKGPTKNEIMKENFGF